MTVTLPSRQQFSGTLLHKNEFAVALRDAATCLLIWSRSNENRSPFIHLACFEYVRARSRSWACATNWMAPSFSPDTGLFYVSCRRIFSIIYRTAIGKAEGCGGRDRKLWSNSSVKALDYQTGKIRWEHNIDTAENVAGVLTTAGHLLFTADNSGNLLALDAPAVRTNSGRRHRLHIGTHVAHALACRIKAKHIIALLHYTPLRQNTIAILQS